MIEYRLHPFGSAQVEAVDNGAADGYQVGAAGQGFEYVISSSHAAVKDDRYPVVDCGGNGGEHGEGGGAAVQLAAA